MNNKYLLITVDTEGDNLWKVSDINKKITTKNAEYLYRFQMLCEKYNFIPTYLTNYEMALNPVMKELGRGGLKAGTLEIGAHEHAWNQPPYQYLQRRIGRYGKPFLYEYSEQIIKEKLKHLTVLLEDTFQTSVKSHRGGRWALNSYIVEVLEDLGYQVDCTCTPGIDWRKNMGWTFFSKGPDWSDVKNEVFYLDRTDNSKSKIMEIPPSIYDIKGNGKLNWLRPNLQNINEMVAIIDYIDRKRQGYAEFMIHSSELMPGGSPVFDCNWKIEKLYKDIEKVFMCAFQRGFVGIGLTEFATVIKK